MATSNIMCIFQCSKGYLWFGTKNGLSRFDGIDFKNFKKKDGLLENCIIDITEDREGNLWLVTCRGSLCRLSAAGEFFNYSTRSGLGDKYVTVIAEDREGILRIGTKAGLLRFDGSDIKSHVNVDGFYSAGIKDIVFDGAGNMWVASKEDLFCLPKERAGGGEANHWKLGKRVISLFSDSCERLWIATMEGLVCFFNGEFTTYSSKDGLGHDVVSCLAEAGDGSIWIGTWGGVSRFSNGVWSNFTTENGLAANFINSIFYDREGNLWIATGGGGVSCLNSLKICSLSKKDGIVSKVVIDIVQDKIGRYWFGTVEGLSSYYQGVIKTYTTENGLISNIINRLLEDRKGNLWIATVEGLSVLSSGEFVNYKKKDGLASNVLFDLIEDSDGTIWIGTKKGLSLFKNGTFRRPPFEIEPLMIFCLLRDSKGDIWFSSDVGLYRYSISDERLVRFSTKNGLSSDIIETIFEDSSGKIWIGTEEGISCYYNGGFTNYSVTDGLPDGRCVFILEDNQGNLWAGTKNGLTRFDGKSFKIYSSKKHSLLSDVWSTGITDDSGTLWLGSALGVTMFTPPLGVNLIPPPIYIENVKILEKDVVFPLNSSLHYEQNYIRIGYAGLCFSAPESVMYKCRLLGIDRDWMITGDRSIFYPYLPPGSYTFQVTAINNDGIESESPAELSFTIFPPFWKTWWFMLLMIHTGVLLVLSVVLWRFKRAKEKYILKERTRQLVMAQRMELLGMLAAGAVHDLKNLLGIIVGYSQIAVRYFDGDNKSNITLEKIKNTAVTAVQVVKQILNFTKQKKGEKMVANLPDLLDDIIEVLRISIPPNVSVLWEHPGPDNEIRLHIDTTHFQQIVMNLCINALHAITEGGELKVLLSKNVDAGCVVLEISDTGTGMENETIEKIFNPLFTTKDSEKGTGLGLFVVKQIVDEYHGGIDVKSRPGAGTSFIISLPVSVKT